ncbi:MAG: BACON domain-containing protein, partial [Tannerella sp.]|nr:BACON domain-containing protein [Tannerella sp.]
MKRFKFYPMIAAMISLLVFNACKEDPTLSVSQNSLSFTAEETSAKTVGVETNQDYWVASSSESWVTAQQNGNQLSVSVSKNESFQSDRNATITVSAGEAVPVTISVTQEKTTRYLSVGESTVSYAYDQTGDKAVPISTNDKNWKVSTTATWFTAKKLNESTLVVTVAKANSTITALSGVISVTGEDGGDGQSITVTQGAAPPSISISPSSLSFEYNASSSKSVTVTSNDANWTVKSNNTWITVSKSSASVSVSVSNNTSTSSRSGTVTFTAGSGSTAVTKELSVTQTGTPATNTLSVSPTSLSFTYNATSAQTVTVTTNASSWSYSTTSSWITCTKSGNTLSVKVSTNSSTSSRSGTITFTAGTATSVSVSVTQAG